MTTVYIVEQEPVAGASDHGRNNRIRTAVIKTTVPRTLGSEFPQLWGELGTQNRYVYRAHGEYGSVSEAREAIRRLWPESWSVESGAPEVVEAFEIG